MELLIYEVSIEPDREMRVSRGALHRASVELKASVELRAELR